MAMVSWRASSFPSQLQPLSPVEQGPVGLVWLVGHPGWEAHSPNLPEGLWLGAGSCQGQLGEQAEQGSYALHGEGWRAVRS